MDMSWLNNSIGLIAGLISIITGAIAIAEFRSRSKRDKDKYPPKPDQTTKVSPNPPEKKSVVKTPPVVPPAVAGIKEFIGDDGSYQEWVSTHPQGFVVNAASNRDKNYMVLHRAKCHTVSNFGPSYKSGAFTERQFMKACADNIAPLKVWTEKNGRSDKSSPFSAVCSICKPDTAPE
ncbi:MAG: hypothetical protein M3Y28_08045 [Armatimonadota bacterium]|nr:hypothetical protein [Armatimonadota bacterium]